MTYIISLPLASLCVDLTLPPQFGLNLLLHAEKNMVIFYYSILTMDSGLSYLVKKSFYGG